MIKRFFIIVAIFSTTLAAAQEGTSSPYSYYGIGLTKFKGTVENQSMGGLSIFADSIHVNLRNPAAYGKLKLTTYTVGGSHTRTNMQTANQSEDAQNTSLDYLAIGIPTGKLNFGLGIIPFTSVGYRIQNEADDISNRFTGRGGMNKVFLTTSYAFTEDFSLGVDVNYNFGNVQNTSTVFERGVQYGTQQINRTDLSGFNLNFGLDYRKRIATNLELHAAAMYAPAMDITTSRMTDTSPAQVNSAGDIVALPGSGNINLPDRDVTLPGQYTLGGGLGEPNKWFVGAEYTAIQAAEFNLNAGASALPFAYEDGAQYRLGGFYVPNYTSMNNYMNRIVYRAGIRFEETGLNLNNEGINEFGISFGLGLPAGSNFSNANVGFEYGQRGTTNAGLIKENFFKLSLSLSLSERWFLQRRFD